MTASGMKFSVGDRVRVVGGAGELGFVTTIEEVDGGDNFAPYKTGVDGNGICWHGEGHLGAAGADEEAL